MKNILKKMILATITLPIIAMFTNMYIDGQIAFAAEPTVEITKIFTWDTKVKETIGTTIIAEDGTTYVSESESFERVSKRTIPREEKKEVQFINNERVKEVIGNFIITEEKNLYAKGDNTDGHLGLGEAKVYEEYTKVDTFSGNVKELNSLSTATVVYTEDNKWYVTGKADGYSSYTISSQSTPITGYYNDIYSFKEFPMSGVRELRPPFFINNENEMFYMLETAYKYADNYTYVLDTGYLDGSKRAIAADKISSVAKEFLDKDDFKYSNFNATYYIAGTFLTVNNQLGIISDNSSYPCKFFTKCLDFSDSGIGRKKIVTKPYSSDNAEWLISLCEDGRLYVYVYGNPTPSSFCLAENCSDFVYTSEGDLYILEEGKLYGTSIFKLEDNDSTKTEISIPYIYKVNNYGYALTEEGMYSLNNYDVLTKGAKFLSKDLIDVSNSGELLDIAGNVYNTINSSSVGGGLLEFKIGEGIKEFKGSYYIGFDGCLYTSESNSKGITHGANVFSMKKLVKVGVKPYPRRNPVKIENFETSAIVRYAFSTSETIEGVKMDEWMEYDKASKTILLDPPSDGTYYIHMEIVQGGKTYTYKFGPYEVTLEQNSTSNNDYAYISADMRVPDGMGPTFNIVFTPPADMFLSQELVTDPTKMFLGIVKNGNIDVKVYDSLGNDITNNIAFDYVVEVYKNGQYVSNISNNYLFTKRDEGATSDNVYILKTVIGGNNLFAGVGNQYKVEFNGLKGFDSVTMQNYIPVNTHKFVLNVYVTELPNVT